MSACGPGRHVRALAHRGVLAVGVDVSAAAVSLARSRGTLALRASVFDHIPGAGSWRSALLLDGNIGIGGSPTLLLRRIGSLLAPAGEVLTELAAPGTGVAIEIVRLEHGATRSDWFRLGDGRHRRDSGTRRTGWVRGHRPLVRGPPAFRPAATPMTVQLRRHSPSGTVLKAPPGPFRPEFWRSPLRGPWLTSFLGSILLVLVLVVATTGFISHDAYQPELAHNAPVQPSGDIMPFVDLLADRPDAGCTR